LEKNPHDDIQRNEPVSGIGRQKVWIVVTDGKHLLTPSSGDRLASFTCIYFTTYLSARDVPTAIDTSDTTDPITHEKTAACKELGAGLYGLATTLYRGTRDAQQEALAAYRSCRRRPRLAGNMRERALARSRRHANGHALRREFNSAPDIACG
jgi:hypothetical protein